MKRKTKIITSSAFVIVLVVILTVTILNIPNIKVGIMLKKNDFYELNTYYPTVETNVNPMLGLMAKAINGSNFNDYPTANKAIDDLLENYSDQLGESNIVSFAGLKLANLFVSSQYVKFNKLLQAYSKEMTLDESFQSIAQICKLLADVPELKVSVPAKDIEIPVSFKKRGRGEIIYLNAFMNGHEEEFAFDTGAMKWNLTTDSIAKANGFEIICDSFNVSGITGSGICKIGILNHMNIKDIEISNAVFIIIPDSMSTHKLDDGSIVKIENVLGTDIIKLLKEVQIESKTGKMIVPFKQTENPYKKQNFMCKTGNYMLYLSVNDEMTQMDFDTGNAKTQMFKNYYNKHATFIDRNGKRGKGQQGGFGGLREVEHIILPVLTCRLFTNSCVLKNVEVVLDDHKLQEGEYGTIGIDFIRAFDKVIINFENMFVSVK
ncbi:hypothetical protein [Parabacteroides sp. D26]|uniref:hypothetical protein n=1 Tax=Parabacteroides sp. D26 TaxID=658662 RepID=UPI00356852F4